MSKSKTPISKEMPKHFANEKYRLACSEPYLWMQKAQELRKSADILWERFIKDIKDFSMGSSNFEHCTGSTAMMLYGLTIENLLKAGLVFNGLAVAPNGNFSQKSHDLQALSSDFGLILSLPELELVERLQHFVEWAGRYPIPLYKDGLYPRNLLDGSKCALYGVSTLDGANIGSLLMKIEKLLPTEDEAIEKYVRNHKV